MTEFKVGDRVRIVAGGDDNLGMTGTVIEALADEPTWPYRVRPSGSVRLRFYAADELELVDPNQEWLSATDPFPEAPQNESPRGVMADAIAAAQKVNNDPEFIATEASKALAASEGTAPLRAQVLNEARALIVGDRNNQYGPPDQDFQRTADALNAFGFRKFDEFGNAGILLSEDVASIQILVKLSRAQWSPQKKDHWVDIAGYAGCAAECAQAE